MAQFNMVCLAKLVCPPNNEWRENLELAVAYGGVDALVDVVKTHGGNESLLLTATKVFKRTAENKTLVHAVVNSGALQTCLGSLSLAEGSMEQGSSECVGLLDIVATNQPDAMIGSGIVDSVFKVMTAYKHDDSVLASCITALERVSRKPEGMNEIVQSNGVYTVISTLAVDNTDKGDNANPEHLASSFALLKRYSSTGGAQAIEYIRQCSGVNAVIQALEGIEIGTDDKLLRTGGQLLTAIAGDDLEGALDQLKAGGDVKTTMALISNLALETENIDTIVQAGGIDAIVNALSTDAHTVSTVKATALAIARIADVNENHIDSIIQNGGINALLTALTSSQTMEADVAAAVLSGISSLASKESAAEQIVAAGGIETVITSMQSHNTSSACARAGIQVFSTLRDTHPNKLSALGSNIGAAALAIVASLENYNPTESDATEGGGVSLEIAALEMLNDMCSASEQGVVPVLAAGGIQVALTALERQSSPTSALAALSLLQIIQSDHQHGLEALKSKSQDCVPVLLQNVKKYYAHDEVRNLAAQLLTPLVTTAHVSEALSALKAGVSNIEQGGAGQPMKHGDVLDDATMSLSVFANIPALRTHIVQHGGIEDFISILKASTLNSGVDDPTLEIILASSLRTLASVATNGDVDDSTKTKIMQAKGIKATMQCVKTHPHWQKTMIPEALRIVNAEVSSGNEKLVEQAVNQGAIDISVSAMRTAEATGDIDMMTTAIHSVVELTNTSAGASLSLRKGATRQLISMLKNHANDSDYMDCISMALTVLQRVSNGSEKDQEALTKQNCSEVIMAVMPHLNPNDAVGVHNNAICSDLLSKCVTKEQAKSHMTTLQAIATSDMTDTNAILMTIGVVSNLASVKENSALLTESGVANSLVSTIATVASKEAGTEGKAAILGTAMRGLGRVAKYTKIGAELNATQWVAHVLRNEADRDASIATLECIRDMSASNVEIGNDFSKQNTVELVTWKMNTLPTDVDVQLAGLEALNAMCASTTCNADVLLSNNQNELMMSMSGVSTAAISVVDPEIRQKIYNSGGTTLIKNILKEHLIAPETSEKNETTAAVHATLVLESLVACSGTGLDAETMRQVFDMATAHLFEESSTLPHDLKLQLMGAVCSIHSQSAGLNDDNALDMDRKGIVNKIVTTIAKDAELSGGGSNAGPGSNGGANKNSCGYVKDAVLMKNVIAMMTTVQNALPTSQKANVKSNVALDLVSAAVGFHPLLSDDKTNALISTLVDIEDIQKYVDNAEKNLATLVAEGANLSLSSVTALAASMETLASVSGALDTTTEANVQLAKQMNTIAKAAMPVLQTCDPSKIQEKAMDNCFDLVGRLNQNQTNGGTTLADVTFDVGETEAMAFVEAMDTSKTTSSKINASAMQATQRMATNVNSVKSLVSAGVIEHLTKAANDTSNNDTAAKDAATAGLAQMTKIALEGFVLETKFKTATNNDGTGGGTGDGTETKSGAATEPKKEMNDETHDLIVAMMEANADSNQEEGLKNCVEVLSTTDKGSETLTALVSKSSGNKNAKVQAIVALSNRKQAGKTVTVNVASKSEVKSFMLAAAAAPITQAIDVMSCIPIADVATARQMTDGGALEMLQKSLLVQPKAMDTMGSLATTGTAAADGTTATTAATAAANAAPETTEQHQARIAGGKAAVKTLKNIIKSSKQNIKQEGTSDAEHNADKMAISNKMRDLKIAASIAAALRCSDDPGFSNDCISLLQELTSLAGDDEEGMGLDEESLNLIMKSGATSGVDQDAIDNLMHSMAENSDLARSMISIGGAVDDNQVESQITDTLTSLETLAESNNVTAVLDPNSGKHYYVNRTTNETSWEKPKELVTLERHMDRLVDMCEVRGKEVKDMDTQLTRMIKSMEVHSDKQEVVTKLMTAMNSLSLNDHNCNKIADSGGIATTLRALHHAISSLPSLNKDGVTNPKVAKIIVQCLKLLSRFAINDRFKKALSDANGVELVNHAVKSCLDIQSISQHGVSCLGNMAFNFPVGVEKLIAVEGIKTLESVLQKWTSSATVCEVTLVTMSNIMFRNDPVKEKLGLACGDEVCDILKSLISNTRVVVAAMRAMGNLASFEKNVEWMLENGAVDNIVAAMAHPANKDNNELVQTAIDVIGNLASVGPDGDEEEDEEEEEKKENEMTSIHRKIMFQGGVRGIVEVMEGSCKEDSAVLMSALETLATLSTVESLVNEFMVPIGLLQKVIDIMKQFDWDDGIIEKGTMLIRELTEFEDCVDDLADLGLISVLLDCLNNHDDNLDILHHAQIAFTNMAINYEEQEEIVNSGALDAMLAQLTNKFTNDNQEDNEKLQEIHNEIITTFQRVSCTDEFSEIVGTKGMSEIMGSYDNHVNIDLSGTADYVANLFNLVSQLAFHKANLKYILQSGKNTTLYTNVLNQHSSLFIMRLCESVVSSSLTILLLFFILFYSLGSGGIKNSINAVSRFSNDPNVILHAIQVIDNCGTADSDMAHLVSKQGGVELLSKVVKEDAFEDCVDAAKNARLGIDAMIRSSQSIKFSSLGKAVTQKNMLGHLSGTTEEAKVDPFEPHRQRLTRGNVFAHWGEGGQRFFSVDKGISCLKWKKDGSKSAKGIKSIPLSSIVSVKEGCRAGGHRRGTKGAHDERAFSISSKDGTKMTYIDLEASTKIERDRWVVSIEKAVAVAMDTTTTYST